MPEFMTDGKVPEDPLASQQAAFLSEPPTTGQAIGAAGTQSPMDYFEQAGVRLLQSPTASLFNQKLSSPEEINQKYAPMGPDGKPVKITDVPMTDNAGAYLGKAKAQQLDAEGVLSRFKENNGTLASIGVSLTGMIQDPLNTASVFVPGLGEERSLALVGKTGLDTTGIIGRTAARTITGATGGAAAQAPLAALQYGASKLDPSGDYGLRDAFTDMMYGAAGGAIIHAGFFGGAREAGLLKPDKMMLEARKPPVLPAPEIEQEAAQVMNAPADTKETAIRSSVSQIATGREVDVDPLFPKNPYNIYTPEGRQIQPTDLIKPMEGEGTPEKVTDPSVARGKDMERLIDLRKQIDNFPDSSDPDELRRQGSIRLRVAKLEDRLGQPKPDATVSDLVEKQQQIYRDGFSPGMTADEIEAAKNEVLPPKEKASEERVKETAKQQQPALFNEQEALQKRKASYGEFIRTLFAKHQADVESGPAPHDNDIAALQEKMEGKSKRQIKPLQEQVDALTEKNKAWREEEKTKETPEMANLRAVNEKIEGRLRDMIPEVYNTLERARVHLESHAEHAKNTPSEHAEETADTIKEERRQIIEQHLPENYDAITKGTTETPGRATGAGEPTGIGGTAAGTGEGGTIAGVGEVGQGGGGVAKEGTGTAGARPTGTGEGRSFPQDAEIAAIESRLNPAVMTEEEKAQLYGATKSVVDADSYRKGYEAAADCLSGEGL